MSNERLPQPNDDVDVDDYDENAIMPATPGPWTISDDSGWYIRISAPDPDPNNHMLGRLEVRVETDDIDSRVSKANAHLIAAAPDLLGALELLTNFIRVAEIRFGSTEQQESCEHLLDRALVALEQAKGGAS